MVPSPQLPLLCCSGMQEIKKLKLELPRAELREDAAALHRFPQHCSRELTNTGDHSTEDQVSALHIVVPTFKDTSEAQFSSASSLVQGSNKLLYPQLVSAVLASEEGMEPRILPIPCLFLSICSEQGINKNSQNTTAW